MNKKDFDFSQLKYLEGALTVPARKMTKADILDEIADKWERLTNPKTVEDYGIGVKVSDLMKLPNAREELIKYGIIK